MDKNFDDLFNEFFGKKNNLFEDRSSKMRDEAKKIIEMLENFSKTNGSIDENIERMMDQNLGVPDEVVNFQDGELFFEKRIWHTPTGDLVKVIVTDKPFLNEKTKPTKKVSEKPLQQQLDEAVANEEYEKAANIRDLINPPKKIGRPKKTKKIV
jgi:excinuclease UvrABC helicase subunit UvrB